MRSDDFKIGFLGAGRYSGRLANVLLRKLCTERVFIFDKSDEVKAKYCCLNAQIAENEEDLFQKADVIFIGVASEEGRIFPVLNKIEELLKKQENKNEKILVFMGNLRYSADIFRNSKEIHQIMFNILIDQVCPAENYIAIYKVKSGGNELLTTIFKEIAKNIIEVDNVIDLIRLRFIIGSGPAILAYFVKNKKSKKEIKKKKLKKQWINACSNLLQGSNINIDLENLFENLYNNTMKCDKQSELIAVSKSSLGVTALLFKFLSKNGDLNSLTEAYGKAFKEFTTKCFINSLWDLSAIALKKGFSEKGEAKVIREFGDILEFYLKDWKPYFVWFNIIDTQERKIYFYPKDQENNVCGRLIKLWEKGGEFTKYIGSIYHILLKLGLPNATWIMHETEGDQIETANWLFDLGETVITQNNIKLKKTWDKYEREFISKYEKFKKLNTDEELFNEFIQWIKELRNKICIDLIQDLREQIREEIARTLECEDIKKLISYYFWVTMAYRGTEIKYLMYFPASYGGSIPYSINVGFKAQISNDVIMAIERLTSHLFIPLLERKTRQYALRSAIAAIMSRNMSHNIGSHVLAYLRMEKLFELAVKFVNKDDGESINKIKDLINKIEQYGNTVQSFCNKLRNANNNGVKKELNTIKKQMHSHKEEIQKIINSFTGSELRWGLMEWIEDTKIFFEYLQHRMDFLAQISTEWPEWSFSAYLMKDIMRYFLSQRHLLDGIAKSEGLRGFYYDWEKPYKQYLEVKQKSDQGKFEEYGRIKFHVVNLACFDAGNKETVKKIWYRNVDNNKINEKCRIKKRLDQIKTEFRNNEEEKRILLYTTENSEVNIEEGDIQIAIPGGIIGYHAFYVIFENIIRNSAKHSYSKNKTGDLEIMIEFTDDPFKHDEFWLFRIYDNASCASKDNNAKVKGKRFRIFSEDISDNNDLVAFMNECLRHSIIKETGELDKKHWGMAEMKIAAGYLQGRDISRIGAEGDDITGSENNQDADEEDFIIRAVESPVGTLGFEFKVRKPKEVGIVCYKGEEA